tara:strand:+ start:2789 stop:3202 length:414 start_codon:yes stop_codon:yes gene_type:complete
MSDGPKRIQLSRAKGWRMPDNTVKVDRTTQWGNPFNFKSAEFCWVALSFECKGDPAGRHEASVKAFREWIDPGAGLQTASFERGVLMGDLPIGARATAGKAPSKADIVEALRGKNLACWCAPDAPCHADVLLEIANV